MPMQPFMVQIDAARRSPLDQLAIDYLAGRHGTADFCRRVVGVPAADAVVAARLGVTVATVREWREVGRRGR